MDEETETKRRARQDGTQLAFVSVLRELVRGQFPNEQIRASRRDKVHRPLEMAEASEDADPHTREALRAAMATIDSIFAPGRG